MLKLDRKVNQIIDITCPNGDKIELLICRIDYGSAKLGIEAPPNYLIDRREITYRKVLGLKKENGNV